MEQDTGVTPEALSSRVQLDDRWKLAYRVWSRVKDSRPPSMGGLTYLPYSEYRAYCADAGMPGFDIVELWDDVYFIDRTWVEKMQEKYNEDKPKAQKPEVAESKSLSRR